MARKYKRDKSGRFAGGAGGGSGGGRPGGGGKKMANGSKAVKKSKAPVTRMQKFKKGAKAAGKFAAKNPRLVIGLGGLAASAAMTARDNRAANMVNAAMAASRTFKRGVVADKRGLGGRPGTGLKSAKRGFGGRYKVSSM